MDALLRIFSLLLKLHAIIVLGVSTLPHHVGLGFVALRLLLVHLLDELLLPIQLLDAFVCALLLQLEFDDSVLDL